MTATLKRSEVGNVGDAPGTLLLNTSNTLAQVTTAGYLNALAPASAVVVNPSDIVMAYMSDATAIFYPSFGANNVITLIDMTTAGSFITGGTSLGGTDAIYAGVSGSNLTFKGLTAGANVTLTPSGTDITIAASGLVTLAGTSTMSAGSQLILAKVNGTEAANAVTASGNAGLITTSALTTAAGSSYAITWTNTHITSASSVIVQIAGGTNTVESVVTKVTPGSGSATFTIYNVGPTNALNGTLLFSYIVL